jgi:hypothetical protein
VQHPALLGETSAFVSEFPPPLYLVPGVYDDPLSMTAVMTAIPALAPRRQRLAPEAVSMRVTSEKTRTADGRCEHRLIRVKLGPLAHDVLN